MTFLFPLKIAKKSFFEKNTRFNLNCAKFAFNMMNTKLHIASIIWLKAVDCFKEAYICDIV